MNRVLLSSHRNVDTEKGFTINNDINDINGCNINDDTIKAICINTTLKIWGIGNF